MKRSTINTNRTGLARSTGSASNLNNHPQRTVLATARNTFLPLLRGEGRGEGELVSRPPKLRTFAVASLLGLGTLAVFAALEYFGLGDSLLRHSDFGLLLPSGAALALAPTAVTEEQVKDLLGVFDDIKGKWEKVQDLPASFKSLQEEGLEVKGQLDHLRRLQAQGSLAPRLRTPGTVSDGLALCSAASFILHCERSGKLEALCSVPAQREALLNVARHTLSLSVKAALTPTDIPLPQQYGSELKELISDFGVVRRRMAHYPIGLGTARPARMGLRQNFGSIAMSNPFVEKTPKLEFASLESHKIGGIVRLPREIDEQSIVSMGQFLARYGAVEFARVEDQWGFLADGSGTYETVKGIVTLAREKGKTVVLAAGKTKPSDAILDDFRTLRTKVNKAALNGRLSAYYLDSTWETKLPAFKTAAEPNVYQRLPDGSALLDGYPIVWTDVLTGYGTSAAVDSPLAVFGALSFWWMGEHGTPRIDTSEHVWFANDQLAVRFIEEIDFDYAADDATAALITAAA